MLHKLNIANWSLSKKIISDRNKKFFAELWKSLFERLEIKLLYTTAYHSQANDIFEKTNQIMKIILRFYIQALKNSKNWLKTFDALQRALNNSANFIEKSSNEICYNFTSLRSFDLIKSTIDISASTTKIKIQVSDTIILTQKVFLNISMMQIIKSCKWKLKTEH